MTNAAAIAAARMQLDTAIEAMNYPEVERVGAVLSCTGERIMYLVWFVERLELFEADKPFAVICDLAQPIAARDFDAAAAITELMREPLLLPRTVH